MVTQNVEDMVGVKSHIRNNTYRITSLHAQLETHCDIPHTVPQVLFVHEIMDAAPDILTAAGKLYDDLMAGTL